MNTGDHSHLNIPAVPAEPTIRGNNVAHNSYLQRYLMLNSDSQNHSYAESIEGLQWTDTMFLWMLGYVPDIAGYEASLTSGR
jgi:hypothetical protein